MPGHWHVGNNFPGCLPEAGPACVDDPQHALDEWRDQIRGPVDDLADDAEFLEVDTRQYVKTANDVEVHGDIAITVGARNYWIEAQPGTAGVDCDLVDDL